MNRRLHSHSLPFFRCAALAYTLSPLLSVFITILNLLLIFCISWSVIFANCSFWPTIFPRACRQLLPRTRWTYKSPTLSNRHRHQIFENSTSLLLSGHDWDTPVHSYFHSVRPLTSYNCFHRFQHISSLSRHQFILPASHIITLAPFSPTANIPICIPTHTTSQASRHSAPHQLLSRHLPAFSSHKTPPITLSFWIAAAYTSQPTSQFHPHLL